MGRGPWRRENIPDIDCIMRDAGSCGLHAKLFPMVEQTQTVMGLREDRQHGRRGEVKKGHSLGLRTGYECLGNSTAGFCCSRQLSSAVPLGPGPATSESESSEMNDSCTEKVCLSRLYSQSMWTAEQLHPDDDLT
jgi:hypothetical protein